MPVISRSTLPQAGLPTTSSSTRSPASTNCQTKGYPLKISSSNQRRSERQRLTWTSNLPLPIAFLVIYIVALVLYIYVVGRFVGFGANPPDSSLRSPAFRNQSRFGYAALTVTPAVAAQQRVLCGYRMDASRTIIMHMHIPKSGGTAFAMALKSECRCVDIPRPRAKYCKVCPHVLTDSDAPVWEYKQNLWTSKNVSFDWPYSKNCRSYYAASRFRGFPKRSRSYSFYSQNRLTSGWPCGVHSGYARLRECCHRLRLPGVKHVIVSLFREPLARFVSEFYQVAYNRRVISSWDWCMNRTIPLTLTQFFGMDRSYPMQNRMTKLLSGSPIQTGAAGEDWRIPNIRKRALHRALGVIGSTEDIIFGLAEEMELTLEMFQFLFKRSFKAPSTCHSHANKTACQKVELGLHDLHGKPLKLTTEQIRLFHENNKEDKVIYDAAVKLFWERVEAMRSLETLGSDFSIDRRCHRILKHGS